MFRKTRSASITRKKRPPLSMRAHSLDRINVLNKGNRLTRQNKRLNLVLASKLATANRMRKTKSKSGMLLERLGHPRQSYLLRGIASFMEPKGAINERIVNTAFDELANYYGNSRGYREYLQRKNINIETFCKIMFFIKKNHHAQLFMGLYNVLSRVERDDKAIESFEALTAYDQYDAEDQIIYDIEDQLTASKIASLYERNKIKVDNIQLSREEQRILESRIRQIQIAIEGQETNNWDDGPGKI